MKVRTKKFLFILLIGLFLLGLGQLGWLSGSLINLKAMSVLNIKSSGMKMRNQ